MSERSNKDVDEVLLLALACGATAEQAAGKAGVSKRTVYRRLQDPAFMERIAALRTETVERAAGMLTAASMEAVKTMLELLSSAHADSVRLRAAQCILDEALRLREAADFGQRLQRLEKSLPKLRLFSG